MTDSFIVQSGVVSVQVDQPSAVDAVLIQGPRGPTGPTGPPAEVFVQTLSGDGTTGTFQLDFPAATDSSVQVFRNGLAEIAGVGFTASSDEDGTGVSFSTVPLADDEVQVVYQV